MNMTKKQAKLASYIQDEMTGAEGGYSDTVQSLRQTAIKYYNGEPRGDEVKDRSGHVSMDTAAAVNTTLALMRSMLISECGVKFEAEGPEDEALAEAERDICTDVFYSYNDGETILMNALKDGLLSRQAWVGFDAVQVGDEVEIVTRAVASENIMYRSGWEGDLQEIPFIAEGMQFTRSELVELGISKEKVDKLPTADGDSNRTPVNARDRGHVNETQYSDKSQDYIWVWVSYIIADCGEGAKRYRALYCDNKVNEYEPYDVVPLALGSPFVSPHRLTGESLFERVQAIQDVNTALQRQLIDNISVNNNSRVVYDPAVTNEYDVMNPKAGGGIRSRDPMNGVAPLVTPDMTTGILGGLEFFRRKRAEVAGASTDMGEAGAQMMNKSATQASIDKAQSELITNLIASTFAATLIKQCYYLTRYFLRNYATRPYLATVNGQAVPVNPVQWPEQRRIKVTAGKSPSEKAQEAAAIAQNIALSAQMMQAGMAGQLADAQTLYRNQIRYLKLNGVDEAESLLIDPTSPQAQQAQQQQAQMQQQMQAMQQEMIKLQSQLEQAKLAEDARQADQDNATKIYDIETKAEIEMAKTAGDGSIKLEVERMKTEQARAQRSNDGGADNDRGTLR